MQQDTRDYEMVFIATSALDDQGLAALNERVTGWITTRGGAVTATKVWGRQTLAYAIGKHTDGIYIQFNFQLAPQESRELDRTLRIDEQIIRHLIVRSDEV